jgi:hypothetical protein
MSASALVVPKNTVLGEGMGLPQQQQVQPTMPAMRDTV